ncbi:glycosyltransferase family 4 protein [Pigmentiphaga aceris]|uniref:Glycosyltransferase family 4 protein n=1 Tax=Pigmentiphaga aceris TaxID=1940612 RepID=A0A5C0B1E9_9BURK|nr:glycosyltransferase [Pigmentiphaga aceris]QEI08619.1 glycosyltransferase family 4 protein [Pigmentiphaga aceris]
MAFHALRRRLRPRTRLKQAIFAAAAAVKRRPELTRQVIRLVRLVPPLDARLRRILMRPPEPITPPRAPGPHPRELARMVTRLTLAREVARHSAPQGAGVARLSNGRRPRMAYVSPLPPQKSGIADYSGVLLQSLREFYDITLINPDASNIDPWLTADFPLHDSEWLVRNGYAFDRVMYHFGNSTFHTHMLDLLQKVPGVVVQHDFYLSGLRLWLYNTDEDRTGWYDALRYSHGWQALSDAAKLGNDEARVIYPCSKDVIDASMGVLTHSLYSKRLAAHWYSQDHADRMTIVPFAQTRLVEDQTAEARSAVREELGLADDEFVVASFGHIAYTKRNDALLDAWVGSELAADPKARLVFVGQANDGDYGHGLIKRVKALGPDARVSITGYADTKTYDKWLQAVDLAVQLRTQSRGETSGTIFDCLTQAVPVVVNAHGWAAELPHQAVIRLPDDFTVEQLRNAIVHARQDPAALREQGQAGRSFVHAQHVPAVAGPAYRDAIERNYAAYGDVHREILASTAAVPHVNDDELREIALGLLDLVPRLSKPQWLLDVTALNDSSMSSERAARFHALADSMIANAPDGWRIEPVYFDGAYYRYANQSTMKRLGLPAVLPDEAVDVHAGDRYLSLGLSDVTSDGINLTLTAWQRRGVSLNWLLVDAAPLWAPVPPPPAEHVPTDLFEVRLATLLPLADRIIADTPALAQTLMNKLDATGLVRPHRMAVEVCELDAQALTARLADAQPTHIWPRGYVETRAVALATAPSTSTAAKHPEL